MHHTSTAHAAAYPNAAAWDVNGVLEFLQGAGFGQYSAGFAAAMVNGAALLRLTDEQLTQMVSTYASHDEHEGHMAAAEQLVEVVKHLRWRSRSGSTGIKDEL